MMPRNSLDRRVAVLAEVILVCATIVIAKEPRHRLSGTLEQSPDVEATAKLRKGIGDDLLVKRNFNNNLVDVMNSGQGKSCELHVNSPELFSTEVLKKKYNFVYLNLSFHNVSVMESESVIMYRRWIWTYKGENGGYQYLYLPGDFGYLSFKILWSYTHHKPMLIDIYPKDKSTCGNLTVGKDADQKIGDALGSMTAQIASQYDMYNSSYWCYTRRLRIQSDFVFAVCKHYICTLQTIEYTCCRFVVDVMTKERHVDCSKTEYHFKPVWWLLPIIIGNVLFAYYPLLLIVLACSLTVSARRRGTYSVRLDDVGNGYEVKDTQFIWMSKYDSPITFSSTVCEPLGHCNIDGSFVSRLKRIVVFIIPFIFTLLKVLLDYKYADDLVKAAVSKGALMGFSTMLADYKMATQYFLHYFGGPFVALPLSIVLGCLLIVVPGSLEKVFEAGLIEFNGKSIFLFTLSVESKGRLAGVGMPNAKGYKRLEKTLLSQCLMLLNCRFWQQTFKLFVTRFSKRIVPLLKALLPSPCVVVLVGFPLLLLYIGFCVIELVVSCIYFAFPVISCFFIFLKAYAKYTQKLFHSTTGIKRLAGNILTVLVTLSYIYTWYLYCLVFFDAFWFLTKIIMFTYTGVIAFPKLSYGYMSLSFIVIYYIIESFRNFQSTYQDLLHVSIKACQRVEEKLGHKQRNESILSDKGLPIALWNIIVDRHCPKRIQVARTLFYVFAVLLFSMISWQLLYTFDKFHDLSLITHVLTMLVVFMLPKMIMSLCKNALGYQKRKKLQRKIQETICDYIDGAVDNVEADVYLFDYQNGYEELTE